MSDNKSSLITQNGGDIVTISKRDVVISDIQRKVVDHVVMGEIAKTALRRGDSDIFIQLDDSRLDVRTR